MLLHREGGRERGGTFVAYPTDKVLILILTSCFRFSYANMIIISIKCEMACACGTVCLFKIIGGNSLDQWFPILPGSWQPHSHFFPAHLGATILDLMKPCEIQDGCAQIKHFTKFEMVAPERAGRSCSTLMFGSAQFRSRPLLADASEVLFLFFLKRDIHLNSVGSSSIILCVSYTAVTGESFL